MKSFRGSVHAALIEAAADAIIAVDSKERIILFNPAAESMFGCPASRAIGQPVDRFIPKGLGAFLKDGGIHLVEGRRPDTEVFPVEASLSPVTVNRRKLFIVILRDISARLHDLEALRDSERRLRAIYDRGYEFMGLLKPDGTLIDANQTALRFVGATLDEVAGRPFWDTPWWQHDEDGRNQLKAAVAQAAQGNFVRLEARHRNPRGNVIVVDFSLNPVTDDSGRVVFLIPEGRNITDLKLAEATVRQQARLLESSYDAIFVRELHGKIRFWNRAAEDLYGWSKTEAIGKVGDELLKTVSSAPRAQIDEALLRDGYWTGELVQQTRHGLQIEVDSRLVLVREGEEPPLVLETNRDITKRKQEEAARLKSVVDSAMIGIISVDQHQRILVFNPAAEKMFGYSAAEMMGQPLARLIPERFRPAHDGHVRNFAETGETTRMIGPGAISGLRSSGDEFPIEASISRVTVNGQPLLTVILRDITARKQAEEQLREQAALLDYAPDAIAVRDLQGKILYWNKGAERMYGWTKEEVLGGYILDRLYRTNIPEFEQAHQGLLERGEWRGELRQFTKDLREITAEVHWVLVRDEAGKPQAVFSINTDITEKKRLEAQLLRVQRLESIGTLASGIAHDLNNALSPISLAIESLLEKATDEESEDWLRELEKNVDRAASMVQQILDFARGSRGERVNVQFGHLVRDVVRILKDTFPKSIDIHFRVAAEVPAIQGDLTQLHQVLMNLCVNARDAMPTGGSLEIRVEGIELKEDDVHIHPGAKPGRHVLVTVSDDGIGMPEEIMDKIFDPFFTTKEPGKGTGLGLSTALGIVKGHGGFIKVHSTPGKGTVFQVYLPALEQGAGSEQGKRPRADSRGAGQVVLVVDDEEPILKIMKATLERHGYRVLTAADGREGMARFWENPKRIGAIILDLMMPHSDGSATIRALREAAPNVPIIVSSGVAPEASGMDLEGVTHFLNKPVSTERLLAVLADVFPAAGKAPAAP